LRYDDNNFFIARNTIHVLQNFIFGYAYKWNQRQEVTPKVKEIVMTKNMIEQEANNLEAQGKPKKTFRKITKKHLGLNGFTEISALERTSWHQLTHVANLSESMFVCG